MKRGTSRLIASALIFAVFLGWVLLRERKPVPQKGAAFNISADQASRLQVKTKDRTLTMEKQGDQWVLTEPIKGWADKDAAERLVKAVAELKPTGSRTEEQLKQNNLSLDNEKLGLKDPVLTATLTYRSGKTVAVSLGAQTAAGSEYFARIEGRNDLYFVPTSLYNDLTAAPDTLRDKTLVHVDKDAISAVTLQYPDRVLTLEKRGTPEKPQWMLTQPYEAKADEWNSKQIGDALADLKAEGFAPETPAAGKSYGFDKPMLKATVRTKDGKQHVVTFGAKSQEIVEGATSPSGGPATAPKDIVYAQVEGRPEVLMVADSNLATLQRTDMDVRDKRILNVDKASVRAIKVERKEGPGFTVDRSGPDAWRISAPIKERANKTKVDDLLWDITDLEAREFLGEQKDLKAYGLVVPDTVFTLTLQGQTQPVKVYVGYKKSDGVYYARTSLNNQVYAISDMLLLDLPKKIEELKDTGASAAETPLPGTPPPGAKPHAPGS